MLEGGRMTFDPNAAAAAGSGIFGLPHGPLDARVVLLPVPWDATTSYGSGAADGPRAILEASKQVDLFDAETGKPFEAGIAMLPESPDMATKAGLKPWREVVTPHKDVASGRYMQAEFAADLAQVHQGEGSDEYRDPTEFFRRTYGWARQDVWALVASRHLAGPARAPGGS